MLNIFTATDFGRIFFGEKFVSAKLRRKLFFRPKTVYFCNLAASFARHGLWWLNPSED
jgi:hypothetical protein